MIAFDWTPIRYRNVISVLKNPFYAGACIYGKSEHRTASHAVAPSRLAAVAGRPVSSRRAADATTPWRKSCVA